MKWTPGAVAGKNAKLSTDKVSFTKENVNKEPVEFVLSSNIQMYYVFGNHIYSFSQDNLCIPCFLVYANSTHICIYTKYTNVLHL